MKLHKPLKPFKHFYLLSVIPASSLFLISRIRFLTSRAPNATSGGIRNLLRLFFVIKGPIGVEPLEIEH